MSAKRAARGSRVVAWVALVLLSGCAADGRRAATSPDIPREGNAALLDVIAAQPYVTAEPGYRAAHLLWKGAAYPGEFDELRRELAAGHLVREGWQHAPDSLLTRSQVGYLICRAAGIRSGVNWRLTGLGRYAWRELYYLQIVGGGGESGYVPGGQFVGILLQAEEYMRRYGDAPAEAELGPQP